MDSRISLLRILACFLIIVVHISAPLVGSFDRGWWAAHFFDSFSRIGVALFLMITGASLLHKVEPILEFARKRLLRIVPPLIAWSLFYLWWRSINDIETSNWLILIASGPVMYHLWFLYAIIGLYALLPLLRRFYQTSTPSERLWVLIVWFVVSSLGPAISSALNPQSCGALSAGKIAIVYHLSLFNGCAGFLLLGAVLAQKPMHYSFGLALYGLGSLATMGAVYLHSMHIGKPCETFYSSASPFVIIAACGLFSTVMSRPPSKPSRMVSAAAECTLGIYCLHIFIIGPVFKWMHLTPIQGAYAWITIPITAIVAFTMSMSFIFAARRIPALRFFL